MNETQRAAAYAALGALESPRSQQSWCQRAIDDARAAKALRAALAEPAPEPVGVVDFINLGAASFQVSRTAAGYIPKIGTKLYAAPVREPAPVPLLTDDECDEILCKHFNNLGAALRAVEALVRQKAGCYEQTYNPR